MTGVEQPRVDDEDGASLLYVVHYDENGPNVRGKAVMEWTAGRGKGRLVGMGWGLALALVEV